MVQGRISLSSQISGSIFWYGITCFENQTVTYHASAVISISSHTELVSAFIGELLFIVCLLPKTQKSYVYLHKRAKQSLIRHTLLTKYEMVNKTMCSTSLLSLHWHFKNILPLTHALTCPGVWWANRVRRREQCLSSSNSPRWNIAIEVSTKQVP